MKKDLFISHASEDKEDFVRPLSELLRQYGIDVWFDEFELRLGRSVSRSIDKGILGSEYGLIVLSRSFFNKNWTEYELRSFISFEVEKGDVLLPIWKNVSEQEVRNFSPYLADKFALKVENSTIQNIALKIIEVVKPDIFKAIHQKILLDESRKAAKIKLLPTKKLVKGPIRHPQLHPSIVNRIRFIRSSLWLGYPHSMEFWIDGFQRDIDIEKEISDWEHYGACFLELLLQFNLREAHIGDPEEIYSDLFHLVFTVLWADLDGDKEQQTYSESIRSSYMKTFNENFVELAKQIVTGVYPPYDIEEEIEY